MLTKTALSRLLGLLLFFTAAALPAPELSLDQVLEKLSQSSGRLQSFKADIQIRNWTELLEEFDQGESGYVTLLRRGDGTYLRRQIDDPQTSILVVRKGQAIFYQPLIKQAVLYEMGKRRDGAANLFMAFTSDRKSLERDYETSLLGRRKVGESDTYVLQLVPRSAEARAQFSRIVFYLDPKLWLPLRQEIVQPNKDYQRIDFSSYQVNPRVPLSTFELELPKDVKKKTL